MGVCLPSLASRWLRIARGKARWFCWPVVGEELPVLAVASQVSCSEEKWVGVGGVWKDTPTAAAKDAN